MWQKMWFNRPVIKNRITSVADEPGLDIVRGQKMIKKYRVC